MGIRFHRARSSSRQAFSREKVHEIGRFLSGRGPPGACENVPEYGILVQVSHILLLPVGASKRAVARRAVAMLRRSRGAQ